MRRIVVLLLLFALPIRTVLAVSGFGCASIPTHELGGDSRGVPCAAHASEGASMETEDAGADTNVSCPSCALACCAALAPEVAHVATAEHTDDDIAVTIQTSFVNAVSHAVERPPRLA